LQLHYHHLHCFPLYTTLHLRSTVPLLPATHSKCYSYSFCKSGLQWGHEKPIFTASALASPSVSYDLYFVVYFMILSVSQDYMTLNIRWLNK
jgi:hypothetical protein